MSAPAPVTANDPPPPPPLPVAPTAPTSVVDHPPGSDWATAGAAPTHASRAAMIASRHATMRAVRRRTSAPASLARCAMTCIFTITNPGGGRGSVRAALGDDNLGLTTAHVRRQVAGRIAAANGAWSACKQRRQHLLPEGKDPLDVALHLAAGEPGEPRDELHIVDHARAVGGRLEPVLVVPPAIGTANL